MLGAEADELACVLKAEHLGQVNPSILFLLALKPDIVQGPKMPLVSRLRKMVTDRENRGWDTYLRRGSFRGRGYLRSLIRYTEKGARCWWREEGRRRGWGGTEKGRGRGIEKGRGRGRERLDWDFS